MDSERQPADAVFFCAVRRRISCDDTTQVFAEKKAAATNIRGATVRVIEDKQYFYGYGIPGYPGTDTMIDVRTGREDKHTHTHINIVQILLILCHLNRSPTPLTVVRHRC